jgi:hypothetical protein
MRAVIIFAYAIVLFLLVRPGSLGPNLVNSLGTSLSGVIKAGTGGGTWAAPSTTGG